MATPMVNGAAGLLIEKKQAISRYDIFTTGAGYLDITGALANGDVGAADRQSPAVFYDAANGIHYIIQTNTAVWGAKAVWGTTAWGTTAVWRTTAVWGTSAVLGKTAVWGTAAAGGTRPRGAPGQYGVLRRIWGADELRAASGNRCLAPSEMPVTEARSGAGSPAPRPAVKDSSGGAPKEVLIAASPSRHARTTT